MIVSLGSKLHYLEIQIFPAEQGTLYNEFSGLWLQRSVWLKLSCIQPQPHEDIMSEAKAWKE